MTKKQIRETLSTIIAKLNDNLSFFNDDSELVEISDLLQELEGKIENIDDIDIKYHWNVISSLLQKFNLNEWVNKKPPITTLDRKQQSLLEFI